MQYFPVWSSTQFAPIIFEIITSVRNIRSELNISYKTLINLEISNKDDKIIRFIKENNIVDDKKIILYPGRLTAWKGQIEFLKVLKKLKNKDFFCYFVGDDKNISFTKKLSLEINNYELGNCCRIMGHIKDMKYIYKLSTRY